MNIGEGNGAQVTLGMFSDNLKEHFQSISVPIEAFPEHASKDDIFDLKYLTDYQKNLIISEELDAGER